MSSAPDPSHLLLPLDPSALFGELRSQMHRPLTAQDTDVLEHIWHTTTMLPESSTTRHMLNCLDELHKAHLDVVLTRHGWTRRDEHTWLGPHVSARRVLTTHLRGLSTSSLYDTSRHEDDLRGTDRLGEAQNLEELESMCATYMHDFHTPTALNESLIETEVTRRARHLDTMIEAAQASHSTRRVRELTRALMRTMSQTQWATHRLTRAFPWEGSEWALAHQSVNHEARYVVHMSRQGLLEDEGAVVYESRQTFADRDEARAWVTRFMSCPLLYLSYHADWRYLCTGKRYAQSAHLPALKPYALHPCTAHLHSPTSSRS